MNLSHQTLTLVHTVYCFLKHRVLSSPAIYLIGSEHTEKIDKIPSEYFWGGSSNVHNVLFKLHWQNIEDLQASKRSHTGPVFWWSSKLNFLRVDLILLTLSLFIWIFLHVVAIIVANISICFNLKLPVKVLQAVVLWHVTEFGKCNGCRYYSYATIDNEKILLRGFC